MNITIAEILGSQQSLEKLMTLELKAKAAFQLKKIVKKANEELQLFEDERRNLVQKYGEEKENGDVVVGPENIEEFNKELQELVNHELELVGCQPLKIDDLENVEITTAELMNLEKFIVE